MQDVRLISLTPLAGSRGHIATALARAIGDNDLLIMLSGPEGSGKSAILAAVVATLAYGGLRTIRVSNPDGATMGQRELAARILGRPTMGSPAQLVAEAITNLIATTEGGQVVLVVDDAHTLSDQAMELLLVITSPARHGMRAPQLLLAGRGAFWDRPWRDELRMLTDAAEKVILEPLTTEDARDFVMAEATASGGTVTTVSPDALTALVHCSSGLTAQMNRIVTEAVALAQQQAARGSDRGYRRRRCYAEQASQGPATAADWLGGEQYATEAQPATYCSCFLLHVQVRTANIARIARVANLNFGSLSVVHAKAASTAYTANATNNRFIPHPTFALGKLVHRGGFEPP